MAKDVTECIQTYDKAIEVSISPRCKVNRPIMVKFELVHDLVEHTHYWVTSAEEVGDAYGVGETEELSLIDLLDSFVETIEWYETEATPLNALLKADYRRLVEYLQPTKGKRNVK